ncbi:BglG family transcription antiterminator [Bacillus sp. OTU530]|uniref:BglG family transcription antiterminator n=1 Tax=Bacillus sp. OTU530 TaxID=3043862 RepID=UPI00313A7DDA
MYISARERQILEILLSTTDELTVKELADTIQVSVRTIHRDLKNLEDVLKEYDLSLLKKSGVGVQVSGSEQRVNDLKIFLFSLSHIEYTPEERQTIILCALLEAKDAIKLVGLANDLNVTVATVSNDLNKLEERLQTVELSLIRKRGYGVEIQGSESAKRRAMSSMISEHIDESEFLALVRENIQRKSTQQTDSISERLLGLVEKKKLLIVEQVIKDISEELSYSMADSAYIGLVVHLALAIERILQGENITIDPVYLENLQSTPEYKIAEKIIKQLETVFQVDIPTAEIGYITMHLHGAKLRHDKEYLIEDSSFQIAIKTKHLIQYVGEQLHQDLTSNRSLFEGLVVHLKPALYRIKQNMGISNPLLHKIKGDYPELFSVVKSSMETTFPDVTIPDEEIGYLVMHFGSVLFRQPVTENLKALVICSSGIGTSKMLATRLQQEFPEMRRVQNVSLFELPNINTDEYDIVVSTIALSGFNNGYIQVSPILNESEIEKIKSHLKRHATKQTVSKESTLSPVEVLYPQNMRQIVEGMHSIREYIEIITTILDGFAVKEVRNSLSIDELLVEICTDLYKKDVITNVMAVVNALLKREQIGGLGIPGTSLALFHTRSAFVPSPAFTIYTLGQPIQVQAMDNSLIKADSILLLLSPEQSSSRILDVLSYISSLVIDSDDSISLFQSKNYEWIAAYLATQFNTYFHEKIKETRSV